MEKPVLFHSIGPDSQDSAAVRKFVVDHGLMDKIEFLNIAYQGAQEKLRARIGIIEAPALAVADQTIRGRTAILAWLKSNFKTG